MCAFKDTKHAIFPTNSCELRAKCAIYAINFSGHNISDPDRRHANTEWKTECGAGFSRNLSLNEHKLRGQLPVLLIRQ